MIDPILDGFTDAHEVYVSKPDEAHLPFQWVGTLGTKQWADAVAGQFAAAGYLVEVRPV